MDSFAPNMGSYIVKEELNQWNIWKQAGTSQWFDYMDQFDQLCTANWIQSANCGNNIKDQLKIQKNNLKLSPTEVMMDWRMK